MLGSYKIWCLHKSDRSGFPLENSRDAPVINVLISEKKNHYYILSVAGDWPLTLARDLWGRILLDCLFAWCWTYKTVTIALFIYKNIFRQTKALVFFFNFKNNYEQRKPSYCNPVHACLYMWTSHFDITSLRFLFFF